MMMFNRSQTFSSCRSNRAGTVYVAVLGVALIIGVIGISSIHVARLEVHESQAIDEMARARLAAQSGVECVLATMKSDSQWRTTYENDDPALLSNLSDSFSGDDSFEFSFIDSDGDLDDDPDDSITIRCVGTAGAARHVIEVLLQPSGEGLTCLGASLHCGGNLVPRDTLTTNQAVSSNSNIFSLHANSYIQGNAQATGWVLGLISGTRTSGMTPALEMPELDHVFEYYIANGTSISYSQLASGGKIERVLLSAASNPFGSGATNPQGIYVIDCQGNSVRIMDSRIQATLVFINVGQKVEIQNSIHWEPALANFPTMMVQGNLTLNWQAQQNLSESILGLNFNPSHTPYQGVSDTDLSDTYASSVAGLVYATGNLEVEKQASIEGVVVVGGSVDTAKPLTLTYDPKYISDAPPGFTSGTVMKLVPGTWKHVAD
jgi:hypothetical protein